MSEETVRVRYYDCNCADVMWLTKYCDEHHTVSVSVPKSVLDFYKNKENNEND